MHLQKKESKTERGKKPGSCVSLLPVTRSRTRRGPKPRPCSDAARFHVSFHDKHSRRRPRILFICPADGRLRLEARQRRVGERYLQPKKPPQKRRVTCVIFSSLPSSSGSLALAASNRAETTPNSLRSACLLGVGFRPDPVTPADLSSLLVMAVPCCVLSSKRGPSLSLPCPSLLLLKMCYQPLTSPENLQKTAHQHAVKTHIFRAGLRLILPGREKK